VNGCIPLYVNDGSVLSRFLLGNRIGIGFSCPSDVRDILMLSDQSLEEIARLSLSNLDRVVSADDAAVKSQLIELSRHLI
jgi:hypothetical protein